MSRRKIMVLSITLVCATLLVGAGARAMSDASSAVNWHVIAGGGGSMQSSSYMVNSTVGQAVVGPAISASYRVGGGFGYGMVETVPIRWHTVYLPMMHKNYR
jgi:hypothetical protein